MFRIVLARVEAVAFCAAKSACVLAVSSRKYFVGGVDARGFVHEIHILRFRNGRFCLCYFPVGFLNQGEIRVVLNEQLSALLLRAQQRGLSCCKRPLAESDTSSVEIRAGVVANWVSRFLIFCPSAAIACCA